jgi:hypothetical protein
VTFFRGDLSISLPYTNSFSSPSDGIDPGSARLYGIVAELNSMDFEPIEAPAWAQRWG